MPGIAIIPDPGNQPRTTPAFKSYFYPIEAQKPVPAIGVNEVIGLCFKKRVSGRFNIKMQWWRRIKMTVILFLHYREKALPTTRSISRYGNGKRMASKLWHHEYSQVCIRFGGQRQGIEYLRISSRLSMCYKRTIGAARIFPDFQMIPDEPGQQTKRHKSER